MGALRTISGGWRRQALCAAAVVAGGGALGSAAPLGAQVPGVRLEGIVTDTTGLALPGAEVTVVEVRRSVVVDNTGFYVVPDLPRQTLTVRIRRLGYAPRLLRVDLTRGYARLDVRLSSAAVPLDSIAVVDEAAEHALHTERATALMTAEDVQRSRGQTLGETMEELTGVALIQFGPSLAKPVVRGLHSQRLRVMNGDIPQEGQQWGEEHAPEIDAFAANQIEVIRGSGFVLYGSDAIGGVVRVLPRPLPESGTLAGELTTNLFANNRQGAASLLFEGGSLRPPLVGRLGWRIQGSYRRAGDARTPGFYLRNTGFEEKNLNLSVGLSRSWGTSQISYSRFATRLGMYLGAHVSTVSDLERAMRDPLRSPEFTYAIQRPNQKVSHDLLSWRTSILLGSAAKLDLTYGFQFNNRQEFDGIGFASGSTRPAFGLELHTHTVEVRLHHAPIGPFVGTLGVSGMRQGNLSPGRSFLIPQYRLYATGVYGLEQARFRRWTFSAGIRYDYRWQHAYQFGDPVILSPDERRSWDGVSGSLGATLEFARGWSIAATLGRAWRAPNVSERFSAGVHHGTAQYQLGDTSLTVERGFNVDATLRHLGQVTRLEASVYQNRIDNYIYLRPSGNVATIRGAYPGYRFASTDASLRGVELTGQLTPRDWLSLHVSGTIVRGRDRVSGEALFDMPADRLIASLRLIGAGGRRVLAPYVEVGTTLVRKQDRVPTATVYRLPTDGYALVHLEMGADAIRLLGLPIELNLAVRNLFDTAYRDYLTRYRLFVDDPGRDVVVRLTVPFGTGISR